MSGGYLGNPNLKKANTIIPFTEDQKAEWLKCADDHEYFIRTYVKIINVDHGLIPFNLFDFQAKMVDTFANNRFVICKLPRQVGKCFIYNTDITLKNPMGVDVVMSVGEFYDLVLKEQGSYVGREAAEHGSTRCERGAPPGSYVGREAAEHGGKIFQFGRGNGLQAKSDNHIAEMHRFSESIGRKFVNSIPLRGWKILTDTGYHPISHIHKTIPYQKWTIRTLSGDLVCADDHIVFDENMNEIYAKDLIPRKTRIQTKYGLEIVESLTPESESVNMFDVTVDSPDHRMYTNHILSHNTTTVTAYFLWKIVFHSDQNIAILANKGRLANDILEKIKLAYEFLPLWMQQGVIVWNKGNIELENRSKVLAAATSSSAIRGGSYTAILLDEFAHVPRNMADSFFASVYPTISSGKTTQLIIVSTPLGMNHFHKLWVEAEEGRSEYVPVSIHWSEVPGRDEAWKQQTIKNTSEEQFRQEHLCVDGNTVLTVRDKETGEIKYVKIRDLYEII